MLKSRKLLWSGLVLALAAAGCDDNDNNNGTQTVPPGTCNGSPCVPQAVTQDNLVSDMANSSTFSASNRDANLINAWGLAFNPTNGFAWVAANGTGRLQVYDPAGVLKLSVTLPNAGSGVVAIDNTTTGGTTGTQTGTPSPTGQVFNPDATAFGGDSFIAVTEQGTIVGWQQNAGTVARLRVDNSAGNAVYKGVAIGTLNNVERLFAADFHNARIDVFDTSYQPVTLTSNLFRDSQLPTGYAPFNVYVNGSRLYVAYAQQQTPDKVDEVAGDGRGYVDVYDLSGNLRSRLITQGALNAPWGMVVAPANFGNLGGRLLVGNFGNGRISAYRLGGSDTAPTASFESQLIGIDGQVAAIDGLWALSFPPANIAGVNPLGLYFTAGPNDETDGLYGRLNLANANTGNTGGTSANSTTGGTTNNNSSSGTGTSAGNTGNTGDGSTTGSGT
jgi:uncharacterized protein (TIGR03118 family)